MNEYVADFGPVSEDTEPLTHLAATWYEYRVLTVKVRSNVRPVCQPLVVELGAVLVIIY